MLQKYLFYIAVIAMTLVIIVSNILVSIAINNWLTWGALSFPFVYLVTDLSNRTLGPRRARLGAWLSLPVALVASWYFADIRIALASGTAFIAGQLLDITLFNALRKQSWWKAPWIASMIGSIIDTALFFSIAFAGTELDWVRLALGDLGVKWVMATLLLAPYRALMPYITNWHPDKKI